MKFTKKPSLIVKYFLHLGRINTIKIIPCSIGNKATATIAITNPAESTLDPLQVRSIKAIP
jgi:hypothetical protein